MAVSIEALREYLDRYGKPLALYSDKATIFRVNRPGAGNGPGYTQFSRALYELNIDGICANTPAAKGRVERAHLTLQDRLVKEFRLAGISSLAAANALMPSFIEAYNGKFAKVPRNPHDAHRPLRPEEDLDLIFAWRELRKVSQNLLLEALMGRFDQKVFASMVVNRDWAVTRAPGVLVSRLQPELSFRVLLAGAGG